MPVEAYDSAMHDFQPGDSVGMASWLNDLVQNITHLKERADGAPSYTATEAVAAGALLIADPTVARGLKKSLASAGQAGPFWVAQDTIAEDATGYAAQSGIVSLSYTGSDPTIGQRLQASGTAGVAQVGTTNSFATALEDGSGGTVLVMLDGPGGYVVETLLDFTFTSALTAGGGDAVSATTWTAFGSAISSSKTFTTTQANSLVIIACGGFPYFVPTSTNAQGAARLNIDSGSQYKQFAGFFAQTGLGGNVLQGAAFTVLNNLSAGSHTVSTEVYSTQAGTLYCRPNGSNQETLYYRVLELRRAGG